MRKLAFWAGFLSLAALTACEREMSLPVYLQIDSVRFTGSYYTEGTASTNITDVWVTVNGKSAGVYELPATVPVIASGHSTVQMTPGIKMNGLAVYRPSYPFYSADVCELDLEPTKVYAITPSITYLPGTVFDFKEDFEDAGIKFQPVGKSVGMSKTADPSQVFRYLNEKSNYSGLIRLLPEDSSFFEVETSKTFVKSSKATYYFLEMNYCFTHNVEVGIYYHYGGRNYQYPICGIYGSKERGGVSAWKKVYVNLSEAVNSIQVSDYEVYFKSIRKGTDTALYLFDNIKVLYI